MNNYGVIEFNVIIRYAEMNAERQEEVEQKVKDELDSFYFTYLVDDKLKIIATADNAQSKIDTIRHLAKTAFGATERKIVDEMCKKTKKRENE